jgi:radical SAM superfamily enzyme
MEICAHLILNLPGDEHIDVIENAKILSALKIDQVKLHALYILEDTKMGTLYKTGAIQLISQDEYVERVIEFLAYLHPDIVVQRLLGRAPRDGTLFVNWQTSWWKIQEEIERRMEEAKLMQGCKCDYLNGSAVRRFLGRTQI